MKNATEIIDQQNNHLKLMLRTEAFLSTRQNMGNHNPLMNWATFLPSPAGKVQEAISLHTIKHSCSLRQLHVRAPQFPKETSKFYQQRRQYYKAITHCSFRLNNQLKIYAPKYVGEFIYLVQLEQQLNFIIVRVYIMHEAKPASKKQPKIVTEVDDFGRKKFALKEHDSEPEEEAQKGSRLIDTGRYTSTLVGREEKIGIEKYIGKIEGAKKKKKTEVFYCEVCEVGFKCDMAYLTHVNSPAHNRKLGMNMKVEAVSVETVASKLARLSEERIKSKHERILEKKLGKDWDKQLHAQVDKGQQQGAGTHNEGPAIANSAKNEQDGEKQVEQQAPAEQEQESEDQDQKMMRQLGLPTSFKSTKRN